MVPVATRAEVKAYASQLPFLQLSERSVFDLEFLVTGAFSPLDPCIGQPDYQRVLDKMRLHTGQLFPLRVPWYASTNATSKALVPEQEAG
jgi:ATP sulfurylase